MLCSQLLGVRSAHVTGIALHYVITSLGRGNGPRLPACETFVNKAQEKKRLLP